MPESIRLCPKPQKKAMTQHIFNFKARTASKLGQRTEKFPGLQKLKMTSSRSEP
jgi:hypothetical protein